MSTKLSKPRKAKRNLSRLAAEFISSHDAVVIPDDFDAPRSEIEALFGVTPLPDFEARTKAIFGNRLVPGADLLIEERDRSPR